MTRRRLRVSGVTAFAAAVLVLLPALGWLQYTWLEQIAQADRERRERTLQTAASQLAQDFDSELANAIAGLQLNGSMVEQQAWSNYADRYHAWAQSARAPEIVKAVFFVESRRERPRSDDTPLLRVWNAQTRTFEVTAWPQQLAGIKERLAHHDRFLDSSRRSRRGNHMLLPLPPVGDVQSIVVPVMHVTGSKHLDGSTPPEQAAVRLLGFTIIQLNLTSLASEVVPALVHRHLFDDEGHTEFLIAVVSRDDPSQVIYESDEGAAAIALEHPDASTSLLGPRLGPLLFRARDGRRGGVEREPRMPARLIDSNDGQWRLVAKHHAGSLETAVAAARTRNFMLSSGILALLAAAIGLVAVSARRADRLARQQLEFVAAVSHELRTPVSVVGAAAGNLADGLVDDPVRVRKYGATIQAEARRLAETVERVLQLAGMAVGGAGAAPIALAPADLIREALGASRYEIHDANATVDVELAPELPPVTGDSVALRSVIQNLIGNALKYGGDARWVRVSAAQSASRPGFVQIAVEDHGLGIGPADRRHIFEPFYRGRDALSRQIQGSGLGLHLVRRIVEAHGGSVSVHSEPGRGSTFTIDLPVAGDVPGRGAPAHGEAPTILSTYAGGTPSARRG